MDNQLIYFVLLVLCFSVALNLKLTFNLLHLVRNPPEAEDPLGHLTIGAPIPGISGVSPVTDKAVDLSLTVKPQVLLFLSSRCPVCKEKLAEIDSLLPLAQQAGVEFCFISLESKNRLGAFLQSPILSSLAVIVEEKDYKQLNPTLSSPFYLFIDHEQKLQAGGTIGDEDWLAFVAQLNELQLEEEFA